MGGVGRNREAVLAADDVSTDDVADVGDKTLETLAENVDPDHQSRFYSIVEPIDRFFDEHLAPLADEYRAVCQ